MPAPLNRIQLQVESAVGTTSSATRGVWLGYLASGVTHLAGGLLLGSMWGTAMVQLVPPPYGTNSLALTGSQSIALEVTLEDKADTTLPATLEMADVKGQAIHNWTVPAEPQSMINKTPTRPAAVSLIAPTAVDFLVGVERQATQPTARQVKKRSMQVNRPVDSNPPRRLEKSATANPSVMVETTATPAMASTQQQGQESVSAPQKVHSPAPTYPATALRQGITGRVVLRVRVGADGNVIAAAVLRSSGHTLLDDAALDGVRRWRFQPATQLGVAIEKEIAVPITFQIERLR